jgi:hypothetical protein
MQYISAYITKILAVWFTITTIVLVSVNQIHIKEQVEETPPVVSKQVDAKQLNCLAQTIYYEAGNETLNGQAAVARVVINRIKYGFANTPCNVVYQITSLTKIDEETMEAYKVKVCQFSWVCENKPKPNINDPRYQRSLKVAYEVLANDAYTDIVPKSALFFHNLTVDPLWPYKQVARIGNHIFYSKNKKEKQVNKKDNGQNI